MTVSPTDRPVRRAERWALVALFLVAFLPRAIYPVSRPLQWYFRSAQFFQAVMEGNWTGTLFSEHPGVTVMWLSGGALWGWYGLQSLLGLHPPTPLETEGYAFADRVAVGVLPLAMLVSLGIVWGWFLLRRLFGDRVAWTAAGLWAVDPFHLANSKVLHLDATLSTLMMLSVLLVVLYIREGERRYLVYSAILGGLAILAKVSALFLFPFTALALLVSTVRRSRLTISNLQSSVHHFLLWAFLAILPILLLWPAIWVRPGDCIERVVLEGILRHAGGARDQPILYRGNLGWYDPGPRFYLDVLFYRSTFLTLPFALIGLVAGLRRRGYRTAVGLLIAFGGLYFLQMALGEWKDGRYMLPVLLVLDVLAACGLDWWSTRAAVRHRVRQFVIAGLVILQALAVLRLHPYYGAHYNLLLGGAREALQVFPPADFGEGLDQAGRYVDSLPRAQYFVIGTQFLANEMVSQYVRAPVRDISMVGDGADYLIFGVQYTMRGRDYPRWGTLWEQIYKFREPEFVVSIGGVPYAWVYRPSAVPTIPHRLDVHLGDSIRLAGYRLVREETSLGNVFLLTLYWRAGRPVDHDYTVFVHLQDADGHLVAQQDNPPVRGARPTGSWRVGELIEDPYEVRLPAGVSSGEYVLSVGLYDPATMERAPVFDNAGRRLPEDRVVLTTVQIAPALPRWWWGFPAVWLMVIAVGVVRPWLGRCE